MMHPSYSEASSPLVRLVGGREGEVLLLKGGSREKVSLDLDEDPSQALTNMKAM